MSNKYEKMFGTQLIKGMQIKTTRQYFLPIKLAHVGFFKLLLLFFFCKCFLNASTGCWQRWDTTHIIVFMVAQTEKCFGKTEQQPSKQV